MNNDMSTLHWVSRRGHENVVKLLIKACADVNARDRHERTPIYFSEYYRIKLKHSEHGVPYEECHEFLMDDEFDNEKIQHNARLATNGKLKTWLKKLRFKQMKFCNSLKK